MRTLYAFVCDAAAFSPDTQRIDATGIRLMPIMLNELPFVYLGLTYVCAVIVPPDECRADHKRRMYCLAPDGAMIDEEAAFDFDASTHGSHGYTHIGMWGLSEFTFATDGTYTFHTEIDGHEVDRTLMRTFLLPEVLP